MRLRYLRRAIIDLNEIEAYLRSKSPAGARRIGARIRKRADDLRQFPFQGSPSSRVDARQLYVSGTSYILIYRVVNDEVQILTIVHTSRNRRS